MMSLSLSVFTHLIQSYLFIRMILMTQCLTSLRTQQLIYLLARLVIVNISCEFSFSLC